MFVYIYIYIYTMWWLFYVSWWVVVIQCGFRWYLWRSMDYHIQALGDDFSLVEGELCIHSWTFPNITHINSFEANINQQSAIIFNHHNLAGYHHGFSEIRHGGTVAAIEETDRLASLPRVTSGNLLGGGKPTVFDGFSGASRWNAIPWSPRYHQQHFWASSRTRDIG